MNWNDYEAVWKRQELPVGAGSDIGMLKNTFEIKRRKQAAALVVRDWAEASAGIVGSLAYARIWWSIGREAWPLAIAMILILGVTAFFVKERMRTHRNRLGAQAPLLAKLSADIAELNHQRHLLLTLWWWYLGPIALAIAIASFTILRVAIIQLPPELLATLLQQPLIWALLIITVGGIGCLLWFGWVINLNAVRKRIEPRLTELEKLQRSLLTSP
jgi:hypothetical protein